MAAEPEWRESSTYPGYFASEEGEIRGPSGRILKPEMHMNGYLRVNVWIGGVMGHAKVHTIVCDAFHGPKPTPLYEVGHRDGTRLNNRPDNVRWVTHAFNMIEAVRFHGTLVPPRFHGAFPQNAKLSWPEVRQIRSLYATGITQVELAVAFGVGVNQVGKIVNRYAWRDDPEDAQ
jgi:hypothetical protein